MGSEWPQVLLGEFCSKIGSGATPRGGSSVYLDEGEISLFRSQNIYNDGFKENGLVFISEESAHKLKNVVIKENDVLLNITGDSVARVCMTPNELLPARVNQHVAIIRPDPTKLDPKFLRYQLVSPRKQNLLLTLASAGATRNALTKNMIETLNVSIPPIKIQKSIAHILGSLDDKIELNRQMNETLEAMAQALFKSWFVDFDPVIDNALAAGTDIPEALANKAAAREALGDARKPLSEDIRQHFPSRFEFTEEMGWIPEGWSSQTFGDVASHVRNNVKAEEVSSSELYVGLEHVGKKQLFLSDFDSGEKVTSNKSAFEKYDVLFGKLRPYFHKVCIAPNSGICSTDILVFRAKKNGMRSFMALTLFGEPMVEYANLRSTGTRMPRASAKDLLAYRVIEPPENLAEIFELSISPYWRKGMLTNEQSKELAKLRDTLLPKLLSGELRIPDAEKLVKEAMV